MKCSFCGRAKIPGSKGNPYLFFIFISLVFFLFAMLVYSYSNLKEVKSEIGNLVSGFSVKENTISSLRIQNDAFKNSCRNESIEYIDYYEDYEEKIDCKQTPVYEYRIENQIAQNNVNGASFSYDIINLENFKVTFCDSFSVHDFRNVPIAQYDAGCSKYAPGEKINRITSLPYFHFPQDSYNYFDSPEFKIYITVTWEAQEPACNAILQPVNKTIIRKKSIFVCDHNFLE